MGRLFGCRLLRFERVPLLAGWSFILYKAPMGTQNSPGVGTGRDIALGLVTDSSACMTL